MSDANIHVAKNGKPFGTFSEDDLRAALADGRVSAQDLSWRNGMSAWLPIAQAFPQLIPATASAAFVANDGSIPVTPVTQANEPAQVYPTGWERFGAYFIDGLVVGIPLVVVAAAVGAIVGVALADELEQNIIVIIAQCFGVLIGAVGMTLYYGIIGSSQANATVGQRAMGFKMVDAKTGAAPRNGQVWQWALTRSLALQCCSCIGLLLFIPILTDARKQSLFDSWADLVMVKK
jgi:uncharacterized RDD family membrane protein YckC